jgi:hypothetical protein
MDSSGLGFSGADALCTDPAPGVARFPSCETLGLIAHSEFSSLIFGCPVLVQGCAGAEMREK